MKGAAMPDTTHRTTNDLQSYWMPFTANRQFKEAPRMLVGAKGMYYTTDQGQEVMDGVSGPVTWFWYVTDMEGNPVEQGEGGKSNTDGSGAGVHIWHSYRNFTEEAIPESTFAIPAICQNTRNTCNGV